MVFMVSVLVERAWRGLLGLRSRPPFGVCDGDDVDLAAEREIPGFFNKIIAAIGGI